MGKVAEIIKNQAFDTKQEIIRKIGDLSRFAIASREVLLAIYLRPEMTPGGIVLPHQNLKEDLYQAKAHLVLKIGDCCEFAPGLDVKLNDWVIVKPSDGWNLEVNTRPEVLSRDDFVPCRIVNDIRIRGIVGHPGMVW